MAIKDDTIVPVWLSTLGEEQKNLMLQHSNLLYFRRNETIIKQGYTAGHILYMEAGMAKLSIENQERSTVFKIISNNTFIGLMCSFVKRSFDFSAVAITPSRVRLIDRAVFEQLIRENGDFAVNMVELMSLMTNKIVHDLIHLSHKNVDGAICTVLMELVNIFKSTEFQMPFSRVELADMIGYSRESVITSLSSLQRDTILTVSGKNIHILDPERLKIIARNG